MQTIVDNFRKISWILGKKFVIEFFFLSFFAVMGSIIEILSVSVILPMITILTQNDLATKYPFLRPLLTFLGNPDKIQLLKYFMVLMVGLYLIKGVFFALFNVWQFRFVNKIQVQIAGKLLNSYLYQPYSFHLERNSVQLFKNVSTEVGRFEYFILQILILITEIPIVLGIVFLLFKVEPTGTLFLFGTSVVGSLVYYLATNSFSKRIGKERKVFFERANQYLMEGLNGIKEIKILGVEKLFLAHFQKYHIKFSKVNYYNSSMGSYPKLWLEFITITCISVFIIVTTKPDSNIQNILPFLGIFTLSSFRLMPSFARMSSSVQNLSYRGAVISHIYDELKDGQQYIDSHPEYTIDKKEPIPFNYQIELQNISFRYNTAPANVLENVSLHISKGMSVGIIGQSGSGKSTLIDIIIGLLAPSDGNILIDDANLYASGKSIVSWQSQVGYVPQTIYLTDDTLLNNIAFGIKNEHIDLKAVNKAIEKACLKEFIDSLPEGLQANVGERGVRLSGGQRQRIGIARALYRNQPLLVLDEATSALDSATELRVMNNINELDKTIILITHRLNTIERCDMVVRIENGHIASTQYKVPKPNIC
jgi:ABC-type multidrug transport system fused ATPase/permease subunit